jgi:hypothetical protein
MFEKVDYHGLRRLLDDGAQLVEVLPAEAYDPLRRPRSRAAAFA